MEQKIYNAIASIMDDVEAIAKDKTNPQQGYLFRGIDDMYNALHPLFKKHKVFICPNVLESKREERKTQKGGILIYTIVKCQFKFFTVDGSFIESTMEGEAMDSGDKSTNKSMSAALKYLLMEMFLIPTKEKIDTELESPDVAPKNTGKPTITQKALDGGIKRIKSGELGIYKKLIDSFNLTPQQLTSIEEVFAEANINQTSK